MNKRYITNRGRLSEPIEVCGEEQRIEFSSYLGVSSYATSNEAIQKELETSKYYGDKWALDLPHLRGVYDADIKKHEIESKQKEAKDAEDLLDAVCGTVLTTPIKTSKTKKR
ncbi:MAG: hypothetical protein RR383_08570 [Muribaculaceae bacterium]